MQQLHFATLQTDSKEAWQNCNITQLAMVRTILKGIASDVESAKLLAFYDTSFNNNIARFDFT